MITPDTPASETQGHATTLDPGPLRVLMVTGIILANLLSSLPRLDIASRQLFDTDGYARAVRVLDLVQGRNSWFDGWFHQANAPFGHPMHWTRLVDALLIGLSSPFAPFMGWRDAIYAAAMIFGPLLHVLLGFAVAWVARPLMGAGAAYLAGLAVAVQSGILSYSSAARPDHHIAILLPAVFMLGCLVRLFQRPTARIAIWGGIAAAAGLWVSVEFLAPLVLAQAAFGVWWITTGKGLQSAVWFGRSVLGGILVVLLVERGPFDWATTEFERISIVHLVFVALTWITWEGLVKLRPMQTAFNRCGALALAGGLTVLVMATRFRPFLGGPFADLPEELKAYWLNNVAELAPLWNASSQRWSNLILLIGAALVGILVGLLAAREQRRRGQTAAPWLLITAWLLLFTFLAVRNIRFVIYAEALAAVPLAWWAGLYLSKRRGVRPWLRSLRRAFVMALVVVGFAVPAGVAWAIEGPSDEATVRGDCDLREITPALGNAIATVPGAVVLAAIDAGPELLWRLPVRIIADPYFNTEGILDARDVFRSEDSSAFRAILDRRGVDFVLVCENDVELSAFGPDSLHGRLTAGMPPEGFRLLERRPPFALYAYDR